MRYTNSQSIYPKFKPEVSKLPGKNQSVDNQTENEIKCKED